MDTTARAPANIPTAYETSLATVSKPARTLMDLKGLPYFVQHQLATGGYVTLEDLADRWDTPQEARTKGPAALGFENANNGYDQSTSDFTAMKLYQVVKAAKIQTGGTVPSSPGSSNSVMATVSQGVGSVDHTFDREHLIQIYMAKTGLPKPGLELQGADSLLKAQYKFCSQGTIGFIAAKHLICFLPEEGERPYKRRRTTSLDGFVKDEEEDERPQPQNKRHMERMHQVFQTSLLMSVFAFPQFPQFNISKQDLDSFYSWFNGPSIASRDPAPPVQVLISAERNVWREVLKLMYEGQDLKTALNTIRQDLLFWQREVYEKIPRQSSPFQRNNRGLRRMEWTRPYPRKPTGSFQKGGKGSKGKKGSKGVKGNRKGDRTDKGKGKGDKGKQSSWPPTWATTNPKGLPYCRNYHLQGNCGGQCGRSHNCPVLKHDGWVCNAPPESHAPHSCPNL